MKKKLMMKAIEKQNYFNSNIKLLRKRSKRTQEELAFALGLKRTTINALENKISSASIAHLQSFSVYFKFAIDTLINVDINKLSERQLYSLEHGADVFIRGTNLRVLAASVNNDNEDNIELVSEKAKAGYANGYADPDFISQLPVFNLPFLSKQKKYRAFPIVGDSMLPIPEKAVVVCEYVQDFSSIASGKAYVVLTLDEGIVFKIVDNRIVEHGELLLSSLNTYYKPYAVSVNEIREVWKFSLVLNFEMPEALSGVDALSGSVTEIKNDVKSILSRLS